MDTQIILAVDDEGKFLEYIPKEIGHIGEGRRHLAITVLLYNSKGEVLLQKRKHKIFDNIWDFTGATHPLHKENGADESLDKATLRCLKIEYRIESDIQLKNLGFFNYFAKDGENCEHEHCAMMIGEYNGEIKMDQSIGYEYKWVDKGEFLKDIENNPQNYTPWAKEGVKILKNNGFFNE